MMHDAVESEYLEELWVQGCAWTLDVMRKSFGKRLSVVFERQNEKQTDHPPSDTFAGPKENTTKGASPST